MFGASDEAVEALAPLVATEPSAQRGDRAAELVTEGLVDTQPDPVLERGGNSPVSSRGSTERLTGARPAGCVRSKTSRGEGKTSRGRQSRRGGRGCPAR